MMTYDNKPPHNKDSLSTIYEIRKLQKELLVTLGYALFLYGVIVFPGIFILTSSLFYSVCGLLLLIPTFALVSIRRLNNFFIFLFLHIIIGFAAFYIVKLVSGDADITFVCTAFIAAEVAFSIFYTISGGQIKLNMALLFFTFPLFLLMSYAAYKVTGLMIDVQLSLIAIAIITCYLFYSHIANMDDLLKSSDKNTVAPIESIIKFNNKVVTLLISFMTLLILLARFLFVDKLILFLYSLIDKILIFILSFVRFPDIEAPIADEQAVEQYQEEILPAMPNFVTGDGSGADIPSGIVNTIMYIFAIGIFVVIILYAALDMYKKFNDLPKTAGSKLLVPDVKTYVTGEDASFFQPFKSFSQLFGMSNSEKVRKLFYKKVRRYNEREHVYFTKSETAGEMCGRIREYENVEQLKALYNKARYSDIEITNEELDNLKSKIINEDIFEKVFDNTKKE